MNLRLDFQSNRTSISVCYWVFIDMYLDKIYILKTGASLKISTDALQDLIANAIALQKTSVLESLLSTSDLYHYLTVVVIDGAEELIERRKQWIDPQTKAHLMEGRPVSFDRFCNLFWRTLDEVDPDGDEWHQLIASDQFYDHMTILLNKIRAIVRDLQRQREAAPHLSLGACRT
ncbi:MAG: hypothetical protein LZF61_01525 [Nitrosomonas sp.]|nr:MAG: hypothetical protein LZF61_01525 [Nitrosomonas sp.]